jgi:hypothetical protein
MQLSYRSAASVENSGGASSVPSSLLHVRVKFYTHDYICLVVRTLLQRSPISYRTSSVLRINSATTESTKGSATLRGITRVENSYVGVIIEVASSKYRFINDLSTFEFHYIPRRKSNLFVLCRRNVALCAQFKECYRTNVWVAHTASCFNKDKLNRGLFPSSDYIPACIYIYIYVTPSTDSWFGCISLSTCRVLFNCQVFLQQTHSRTLATSVAIVTEPRTATVHQH